MSAKKISLASVLLVVHGLVTLGYGGALLANPAGVAGYMGLAILSADGQAELITMYVGMSGAVSLFMLYGAFSRKWRPQAALFLAITMSGIALGRGIGWLFLETDSYTLNALFYDIPIALLSWAGLVNLRKEPAA